MIKIVTSGYFFELVKSMKAQSTGKEF